MKNLTNFNDWLLGIGSVHYACRVKMEEAYNRLLEIPLSTPSFKHRPEEIKKMFNHKFRTL